MIRELEADICLPTREAPDLRRAGGVALLRSALSALRLEDFAGETHPPVREALRAICLEAKGEGMAVEQALVAVKEALAAALPQLDSPSESERRRFIDRTVSLFIREFFAEAEADAGRESGGLDRDLPIGVKLELGRGPGAAQRLHALQAAQRRCVDDAHQRFLIGEMIEHYRAWCRANGLGDPGAAPRVRAGQSPVLQLHPRRPGAAGKPRPVRLQARSTPPRDG